ncbi:MAG: hypothetical protein JSS07_11925 [Proteobacteria bacterium]|nr:hypothetical protein [Pseudomonadota bacterium]
MIVGANKEVWAQSLLHKHRALLEEFQRRIKGTKNYCKADVQFVPNILDALESLIRGTTFKPEVAENGQSGIIFLSDDPRLCLKQLVQTIGYSAFKATAASYLEKNQITQKLHDDVLDCFNEISTNLESIFVFHNSQALAINFPTKEDSILFIESLGEKQFYPLSSKEYPVIDKEDPRIVSVPAHVNSDGKLMVRFPNFAIRHFVCNVLDLKQKIYLARNESSIIFSDKETLSEGNYLQVDYSITNLKLQRRRRLLEALRNDDVDAVSSLIEEGENCAHTYLDEFKYTDNQDPAQKAMQQQRECLDYALARFEKADDAVTREETVFKRILANSKKDGPYRKKDQKLILNNLRSGNYSALLSEVLSMDAIKLQPQTAANEFKIIDTRTRFLILLYAYKLEEINILNKEIETLSGLGFGFSEVGEFNAKNKTELRTQVLDKIKALQVENQRLKGVTYESVMPLPAASHDGCELALLTLKLQALLNEQYELKGIYPTMLLRIDEAEAKELEKVLIAGNEKIIVAPGAIDSAKKMEDQNKALLAAKIEQKRARQFAKRKPIMVADKRLTAISMFIGGITFALVMLSTYVGLTQSAWFVLSLLKAGALLGTGVSTISMAVPPMALVISASLGLVSGLALGAGVYYGYRQYANFKRNLPERYKHHNVEASIQIDKFAKLFVNETDKNFANEIKKLRKQIAPGVFVNNQIVNQKQHRLDFKQFEIKAYQKVLALKGDAREKAKQECIDEAKKRFSL